MNVLPCSLDCNQSCYALCSCRETASLRLEVQTPDIWLIALHDAIFSVNQLQPTLNLAHTADAVLTLHRMESSKQRWTPLSPSSSAKQTQMGMAK